VTIRLSGIRCSYRGTDHPAVEVDALDLTAGPVGLVGVNGAGKSTFLRTLAGARPPQQGTVTIDGEELYGRRRRQVAQRIGYLPQEIEFPGELSVAQVLDYISWLRGMKSSRARQRRADVLLAVGLQDRAGERVRKLSGGMRRRLALAVAVLSEPGVLLLDEPTTGLDPAGMRDMRDLVRRLASEGITVLLSSHLLGEVEELCNRVAIIRKGRIVYEGQLQDLLATAATGYRLRSPEPDRARALLLNQPGIRDLVSVDGALRFQADEDAVAAVSIALGQARIGVTALVPETASLEELFLGMTEGEQPSSEEAVA